MAECIFCKIVAGDIPCHKVYEDDHVLAFLDIGPLSHGHTLIVPKTQHPTHDQVPDDVAAACGAIVPRLARAILRATGATAWNLLQNNGPDAGQEVEHVHFHIIPRESDDNLGFRWHTKSLDSDAALNLKVAISDALR